MSAWLLHAENVEALQKSATWKTEEYQLARKNENVDLSKPLCAVAVASEIDGAGTCRTSSVQIRPYHPEAIARVDQRQPPPAPITLRVVQVCLCYQVHRHRREAELPQEAVRHARGAD